MEENRRTTIVLSLALLFGFTAICITQIMAGFITYTFYWGIPVGLIFGIATWIYLYYAWDPYYLEPKNPNTSKASWRLWWIVPLGVITANILSKMVDEEIGDLLLGVLTTWIYATFGYIAFQAWRYRAK